MSDYIRTFINRETLFDKLKRFTCFQTSIIIGHILISSTKGKLHDIDSRIKSRLRKTSVTMDITCLLQKYLRITENDTYYTSMQTTFFIIDVSRDYKDGFYARSGAIIKCVLTKDETKRTNERIRPVSVCVIVNALCISAPARSL